MKQALTAVIAAATVAGTLAVSMTDAAAQRRGWGWGPGIAAGIIAGFAIGAILASGPRGYVVDEGYGRPVHHSGGYWAAQPVYDGRGRVVGYTGDPVQVCPGY